MTAQKRYWMRISLAKAKPPADVFDAEKVVPGHQDAIARLMHAAFSLSVDHPDRPLEGYREEVREMLAHKHGPFLQDASFACIENGEALAACIIVLWNGLPLVGEVMTHPGSQQQGRARFLIGKAMHALKEAGHTELYLAVTEGNTPAETLYRQMGFEFLGPYIPERVYKKADELIASGDGQAVRKAIDMLEEQTALRPGDKEARRRLDNARKAPGP
jgi:GNAT superfamily N-acetyltransferase